MGILTIVFGLICWSLGSLVMWIIDTVVYEKSYRREFDKLADMERQYALETIKENNARNDLFLKELGETLDIDGVELPSFGYVVLGDA